MDKEEYRIDGKKYTRVNLTQARKAYNKGQDVWVIPNHVQFSFGHQWVHPCKLNQTELRDRFDRASWNRVVAEYKYYNCCTELGTYAKFFIIVNTKFTVPVIPLNDSDLRDYVVTQGFNLHYGTVLGDYEVTVPVTSEVVATFRVDTTGLFWHVKGENNEIADSA